MVVLSLFSLPFLPPLLRHSRIKRVEQVTAAVIVVLADRLPAPTPIDATQLHPSRTQTAHSCLTVQS